VEIITTGAGYEEEKGARLTDCGSRTSSSMEAAAEQGELVRVDMLKAATRRCGHGDRDRPKGRMPTQRIILRPLYPHALADLSLLMWLLMQFRAAR
jgi:hypothetical protein